MACLCRKPRTPENRTEKSKSYCINAGINPLLAAFLSKLSVLVGCELLVEFLSHILGPFTK